MLEKLILNTVDFRYRVEDENRLLIYNVRTSEMIFVIGKVKKYILSKLNNSSESITLAKEYISYLLDKKILLHSER